MEKREAAGKSVHWNVRIDREVLDAVNKFCKEHGISRTYFATEAMRRMLADVKGENAVHLVCIQDGKADENEG